MKRDRNEGLCNLLCMKTLYFVFNFICWLTGFGLMGVGIWILLYKSYYNSLIGNVFTIIVALLVFAGVIILIIALVGCCGAIKENRFFLISFLVMIVLIFLLEVAVGITAFMYRDKISDEAKEGMQAKMKQYGFDEDVTESLDRLHKEYKCCGHSGIAGWNASTAWKQGSGQSNNSVPDSCCKTETKGCGVRTHPSNVNDKGCITMLEDFFRQHFVILAVAALGVAGVQLFGILITVCILRFVKEY